MADSTRAMRRSIYERDILEWSEQQAALLRRRAAGELVNDAELDWPNIAEEIESVGQSERYRIQSHIGTVIEPLPGTVPAPKTEPFWRRIMRGI